MRRVRLSLILVFVAVAFLLTWYTLMWIGLAEERGGYSSTDFRVFYTAGRLAQSGHLSDIYNLNLQYNFQVNYFGVTINPSDLLTFNHPPLLIPIQALLFSEAFAASYWRWVIFLILLLVCSSILVGRLLLLRGWEKPATALAVMGWALSYPVFLSVFKGQDTALLLLGAMVWMYGLLTDQDWLAGLGLALTTVRPQIALAMAIPFLFKRRKIWWWFCAGAMLLVVYSVAMLGWRGVEEFMQVMLVSARGDGYGISPATMFNFIGMVTRIFPDANANIVSISVWIFFILVILLLSFTWWKSKKIGTWQIILMVTLCVFAAPHLHYHDLSLLLLAMVGMMVDGVERGILPLKAARLIPLSLSVLLVLADVTALRFWGPYLLMLLLLTWPWWSTRLRISSKKKLMDKVQSP